MAPDGMSGLSPNVPAGGEGDEEKFVKFTQDADALLEREIVLGK